MHAHAICMPNVYRYSNTAVLTYHCLCRYEIATNFSVSQCLVWHSKWNYCLEAQQLKNRCLDVRQPIDKFNLVNQQQ